MLDSAQDLTGQGKKNVLHLTLQPGNYYRLTKELRFQLHKRETNKEKADGLYKLFEAGYHVYNFCKTLG